jgi:pyrroline-5-carboxylate reductase
MTQKARIAFIGAGNMAGALIRGLLASSARRTEEIVASDVRAEALAALREQHGIGTTADNREAVRGAGIVVLAVKPQVLPDALDGIADALSTGALVVSIAAGVPTRAIEARLPAGTRVVRAMPNTPALVGAGATALCPGARATAADLDESHALFGAVGVVVRVDEAQMDAVTALSGSGPAYVFRMIESLIDAGVRGGLDRGTAATLAAETVFGAAKLLRETGEAPEVLRARVTSPGGTTAAGLAALDEGGFHAVVLAAVDRAIARGRELGAVASGKPS